MIRILIIDDEAHIRNTLSRLLESNSPEVSVVGEACGVADGINAIKELQPDLILLDINMKDGTGFDLLDAFPEINFKVIFVSAFNKSMVQGTKHKNITYLTKPFNPEELLVAINRFR